MHIREWNKKVLGKSAIKKGGHLLPTTTPHSPGLLLKPHRRRIWQRREKGKRENASNKSSALRRLSGARRRPTGKH